MKNWIGEALKEEHQDGAMMRMNLLNVVELRDVLGVEVPMGDLNDVVLTVGFQWCDVEPMYDFQYGV